jgi:hypothetical protein
VTTGPSSATSASGDLPDPPPKRHLPVAVASRRGIRSVARHHRHPRRRAQCVSLSCR